MSRVSVSYHINVALLPTRFALAICPCNLRAGSTIINCTRFRPSNEFNNIMFHRILLFNKQCSQTDEPTQYWGSVDLVVWLVRYRSVLFGTAEAKYLHRNLSKDGLAVILILTAPFDGAVL
jgi:hypothetical protein